MKDFKFPALLVLLLVLAVPTLDYYVTGGFTWPTYVTVTAAAVAVVALILTAIVNAIRD